MKKRIVTKTDLETAIRCAKFEVDAFQVHLSGDKFKGTEPDKHVCPRCQWDSYTEERKDWIATADVIERLRIIKSFLDAE